MAHLPQVMHIKRASWKAKPIHVLMDQIERHPQYPAERLHDTKAQKVEASIERNGFREEHPLKVMPHPEKDNSYQLIDGHRRLEAAKRHSSQEDVYVPVVVEEGYPREKYDGLFKERRRWWQRLFGG